MNVRIKALYSSSALANRAIFSLHGKGLRVLGVRKVHPGTLNDPENRSMAFRASIAGLACGLLIGSFMGLLIGSAGQIAGITGWTPGLVYAFAFLIAVAGLGVALICLSQVFALKRGEGKEVVVDFMSFQDEATLARSLVAKTGATKIF